MKQPSEWIAAQGRNDEARCHAGAYAARPSRPFSQFIVMPALEPASIIRLAPGFSAKPKALRAP